MEAWDLVVFAGKCKTAGLDLDQTKRDVGQICEALNSYPTGNVPQLDEELLSRAQEEILKLLEVANSLRPHL